MIYTIVEQYNATISVREFTFISIQKTSDGSGKLVKTLDENNVYNYFYVSDTEAILIADAVIDNSIYNGIPVSLTRPYWFETISEAVEAA